MATLPGPVRRAGRAVKRAASATGAGLQRFGGQEMSDERFVELTYEMLLRRDPDEAGKQNYLDHLAAGTLTRQTLPRHITEGDEFWFASVMHQPSGLMGVHRSRCLFVQQLPRAARILDLGGTHQSDPRGAFVRLGYPYRFERLVIVDLPPEERHPLYAEMTSDDPVETHLGPVEYSFHSMADLSAYDDGSFDLVYSGQTFEHVPEDVGDTVLAEVRRVLRPGGWFALDTPNGAACRLQLAGTGETVTNPDHDIEYDNGPLIAKIEAAGFEIARSFGLTHLPTTFESGTFQFHELDVVGLFDDIERCYVLGHVCRRP